MTPSLITWADIRREPFRLLFPLGILFGIVGVGQWLAYAAGWISGYSGFSHASMQIGAYLYCFIAGFLLTAGPRVSATPPCSRTELAILLGLLVTQMTALAVRGWVLAQASFLGLLAFLLAFAGRRFAGKPSEIQPPTEFVWIPIGIVLGALGAALLALGQLGCLPPWAIRIGQPMALQGFFLSIVIGVGGFLAPRLMGHSQAFAVPPQMAPDAVILRRRRRLRWHLGAAVIFFASFWLEGLEVVGPAYLVRALVATLELLWVAHLARPPRLPALYVRLLWVALWMVLAGLWGAGLAPARRVMMLHVTFLGGASLMIFAVGTMVCLSHAGEGDLLQRPLGVLRLAAVGVAGALGCRMAADVWPAYFFPLLGVAAALWITAAAGWLGFIAPRVWRPATPEVFEALHERVKGGT